MVVVTGQQNRGIGYRPHTKRLPLPPSLHLVRGARPALCQMAVGNANDRAVHV
jgi:hypothetical protein